MIQIYCELDCLDCFHHCLLPQPKNRSRVYAGTVECDKQVWDILVCFLTISISKYTQTPKLTYLQEERSGVKCMRGLDRQTDRQSGRLCKMLKTLQPARRCRLWRRVTVATH